MEEKAKEYIFHFEKRKGRSPKFKSGLGYDMVSGRRFIEIKARKRDLPKSFFFFMSKAQNKMLMSKRSFYIYVVYNIGSNRPKLKIIRKNNSFRKTEESHYRVSFGKKNWSRIKEINL